MQFIVDQNKETNSHGSSVYITFLNILLITMRGVRRRDLLTVKVALGNLGKQSSALPLQNINDFFSSLCFCYESSSINSSALSL